MFGQVIAKNVGGVFLRHSVEATYIACWVLNNLATTRYHAACIHIQLRSAVLQCVCATLCYVAGIQKSQVFGRLSVDTSTDKSSDEIKSSSLEFTTDSKTW